MTATKLTATELRRRLQMYTAHLIEERDSYRALYAEYKFEADKGRASAYVAALSSLAAYTDDEFGQERPSKPKPDAEADGGAES